MIWTYLTLGAPQKYSSIQARLQSHSEAADNIARPLMIRSHIFIYFFTLIIDLNNNNVNDCNVHLFVYIYNIYIGNDTRTVYTYQHASVLFTCMYLEPQESSNRSIYYQTKRWFIFSWINSWQPRGLAWNPKIGAKRGKLTDSRGLHVFFPMFCWWLRMWDHTSHLSCFSRIDVCHWFLKIQVVTERFMSQRYLHADLSMSICLYVSFLFYLEAFASCMYLLVL